MKNTLFLKCMSIGCIFFSIIFFIYSTGYSQDDNQVGPKVKGLYLGMNIKDAKMIIDKRYNKKVKINSAVSLLFYWIDDAYINIVADENKLVQRIQIRYEMFNVDISYFELDNFVKRFMKSYKISEMKKTRISWDRHTNSFIYEYKYENAKQGYEIILGKHEVEMIKIKLQTKNQKEWKLD